MANKIPRTSFDAGELGPELIGRLDLAKYQTGLKTCKNFLIRPHGPAVNRPGFEFVKEVKDSSKATRLMPFIFSPTQAYVMEFGDQYVRFHTEGATILEAAKAVTGATSANPPVVTVTSHGYANGDEPYVSALPGDFAALNGRFLRVANVTTHTFELQDERGVNIDASGFAAYTSGGTVARPVEVATPYLEADLFDLVISQSADTVTIVHPGYAPRELVRVSATSWTLGAITFAPDIDAPAVPAAVNTVGTGTVKHAYVVTAIAEDGLEESLATTEAIGDSFTITGITQANPGIITTSAAHGLAVEDLIYVDAGDMVEITTGYYRVDTVPLATTLSIKTLAGVVVDTTAYTAYTTGGTVEWAFVKNDLLTTGNYNTITGVNVAGAVRYNVYKDRSGVFGYIGQTDDLTVGFIDDNIAADMLTSPPINPTLFNAADKYPGAVSNFAQRRVFAGSNDEPQTTWMSKPGAGANFSYSIPATDNDAITFALDARQMNRVLHLVPLTDLLELTNTGEWRISAGSADAITPSTVNARQQGYTGAAVVPPLIAGSTVLYVQSQGAHVAAMRYALESNAYDSADVSVYAPHLFDGFTISDWTFQRAPQPVTWAVRSDGALLGLTFVPDQEVQAWHKHDTLKGSFESVCSIPESTNEDMVYGVVNRTVDGLQKRFIERMHVRSFASVEGAFFVDSGLSYSGSATTTITGLWHLEGETVNALADGNVVTGLTVANGSVTLPDESSEVHVGLQIIADIETLPLVLQAEALGQGQVENINRVYLRVDKSRGIWAGPDADNLRELPMRTSEAWGDPVELFTGEVDLTVDGDWNQDGTLLVRQADPLPLSILSMVLEAAVGD